MIIELFVIGSLRDWQNPIFPFNLLELFFCYPTHSSRVAEANKKAKEKVQSIAFITAIFAFFIMFFLFFQEIEKVSIFLICWNWTTKSKQLTLFQRKFHNSWLVPGKRNKALTTPLNFFLPNFFFEAKYKKYSLLSGSRLPKIQKEKLPRCFGNCWLKTMF